MVCKANALAHFPLSLALVLVLKQPLTPINEVNPYLLSTQLVPFRSSLTSGRYRGEHSWMLEPGDLLEDTA